MSLILIIFILQYIILVNVFKISCWLSHPTATLLFVMPTFPPLDLGCADAYGRGCYNPQYFQIRKIVGHKSAMLQESPTECIFCDLFFW